MPTRDHYVALAKEIRRKLNEKSLTFKSYKRESLTNRLRNCQVNLIRRLRKRELVRIWKPSLVSRGYVCFPSLARLLRAT